MRSAYIPILAAFEESYELAPRPTTLFNIGMCQQGMFLYVEASATFRRYLEGTVEEGETEMRGKARLAIEELSTLVGRLVVGGRRRSRRATNRPTC